MTAVKSAFIILMYEILILVNRKVLSAGIKGISKEFTNDGLTVQYNRQHKGPEDSWEVTIDTSFIPNAKHNAESCSVDSSDNEICYQWQKHTRFSSRNLEAEDRCQEVEYVTTIKVPLKVTFNISGLHLYGGSEQCVQSYPMEKYTFKDYPYVSTEANNQGVLESYWLDSKGSYVYVNETVPLFISLNKEKDTFSITAFDQPPYIRYADTIHMRYTVCMFDNPRQAHEHAVHKFLGKPSALPDTRMVKQPVWSTRVKHKANVDEKTIKEFANNILSNKFNNSHLEIDDKWETCYGSLTIDKKRFPNMKGLISELKTMGFRVTMWVHPFINLDCEPWHSEAERRGYFVKNTINSTKSIWWNGQGGYIDFTNSDAADWYKDRLKKLKEEIEVDSYKFDAGETSFSPQVPVFDQMKSDHPETILKDYVKIAAEFGNMSEVRVGRGTQRYPIYVRMMDRETNWSLKRGMSSLIPTVILFNMIGYPFVLPDIIGGNVNHHETVDDDLFVRWVQANVFIPSMQFSYPPWEVSKRALNLTKKFVDLHYEYSDKIIKAMRKAVLNGAPVNPPIWWIDPTDPEALVIDSEFLLGEDILIAPILTPNATIRDIYLPSGKWRDEVKADHPIIEGRSWLRNYPADLNTLPFFTKVNSSGTSVVPFLTLTLSGIILLILSSITIF